MSTIAWHTKQQFSTSWLFLSLWVVLFCIYLFHESQFPPEWNHNTFTWDLPIRPLPVVPGWVSGLSRTRSSRSWASRREWCPTGPPGIFFLCFVVSPMAGGQPSSTIINWRWASRGVDIVSIRGISRNPGRQQWLGYHPVYRGKGGASPTNPKCTMASGSYGISMAAYHPSLPFVTLYEATHSPLFNHFQRQLWPQCGHP